MWNKMKRIMPTLVVGMLAAVIVSTYGAGGVVASYSAEGRGNSAVQVAGFYAEVEPSCDAEEYMVLRDDNSAAGVEYPFIVKVRTGVSSYLHLDVDFQDPVFGFSVRLSEPNGGTVSATYINPARTHFEFDGLQIGTEAFRFRPGNGQGVNRNFALLFVEDGTDTISQYQNHSNVEVVARIVQVD